MPWIHTCFLIVLTWPNCWVRGRNKDWRRCGEKSRCLHYWLVMDLAAETKLHLPKVRWKPIAVTNSWEIRDVDATHCKQYVDGKLIKCCKRQIWLNCLKLRLPNLTAVKADVMCESRKIVLIFCFLGTVFNNQFHRLISSLRAFQADNLLKGNSRDDNDIKKPDW